MCELKLLHDVYFGLGSNMGDRKLNLYIAIEKIEERIGELIACSAFFLTTPVGFVSENDFLNAACHVRTVLCPLEVLEAAKEIEREMGRNSKSVNKIYADRIIDVDLLLYDDIVLESEDLMLPHPHLHQREFVLLPLAEIAGSLMHPVLHKTIEELKDDLLQK